LTVSPRSRKCPSWWTPLVTWKSFGLLIVVSVRRACSSLKYCLTCEALYDVEARLHAVGDHARVIAVRRRRVRRVRGRERGDPPDRGGRDPDSRGSRLRRSGGPGQANRKGASGSLRAGRSRGAGRSRRHDRPGSSARAAGATSDQKKACTSTALTPSQVGLQGGGPRSAESRRRGSRSTPLTPEVLLQPLVPAPNAPNDLTVNLQLLRPVADKCGGHDEGRREG
jgi:hypothetical protein